MSVLIWLAEVFGVVSTILSIVQYIQAQVSKVAQEHEPYKIETDVQTVLDNLNSGLFGLSHIAQSILDARDAVNAHTDEVLDGLEVSWPTEAPSWYTAPTTPPTTSAIAAAVWGFTLYFRDVSSSAFNGHLASAVMIYLAEHAVWDGAFNGYRLATKPYYRVVVDNPDSNYGFVGGWDLARSLETYLPALDLSTVEAGDTVYSWLTREYPDVDWTLDGPNGATGERVWYLPDGANGQKAVYVDLRDEELAVGAIVLPPATGATALVPPVFPGEANVTYAASHALSDGLTLTEAMHGLRVTITGAPAHAGRYAFDDVISWQHVGAVIFQDDGGHFERAEAFGLDDQIIVPKTMVQASACIVRLNGGWSGTIRSWTINP